MAKRKNQYLEIPLELIDPDPEQPRREFDGRMEPAVKQALEELSANIAQLGVLEPVLVRKNPADPERFILIAGERRWRASRLANLSVIPAVLQGTEDPNDLRLIKQLSENVLRENLSMPDISYSLRRVLDEFGMTQRQLAKLMGKHESWVSRHLRHLTTEGFAREQFDAGRFNDLTTFETFQRLDEQTQRKVIEETNETSEQEVPRKLVERYAALSKSAESAGHLMTKDDLKDTYVPPASLSATIQDHTFDDFTKAPITSAAVPLVREEAEPMMHVSTQLAAEDIRVLMRHLGEVPPNQNFELPSEFIDLLKRTARRLRKLPETEDA